MIEKIKALTVNELFSKDFYSIPIYQRNYAWSMEQVEQLMQDVINAVKHKAAKYYIGNLIVDRNDDGTFETIDGQQRLTTLFILLGVLKKRKLIICEKGFYDIIRLSFSHRENSVESLRRVYNGVTTVTDEEVKSETVEKHIIDIFNASNKLFPSLCKKEGIAQNRFVSYLLNHVVLLRIEVPEKIDKNHYFEVMNSRGVQLEQHEIIKARLMSVLHQKKEQKAFELIWNACSDMERFVQMNFSADCRKLVFGTEWCEYPVTSFRTIVNSFNDLKDKDNDIEEKSLRGLIDCFNKGVPLLNDTTKKDEEDKDKEHFHAIINFPGFLLHVLKILRPEEDVPLYDKWLVGTFESVFKKEKEEDQPKFAKNFAICLLQCRYLLDSYVIKRNREDNWGIFKMAVSQSQGTLKAYPKNTFGDSDIIDSKNELVMLQSMFHFSTPAYNYKNWLNGALTYLYNSEPSSDDAFMEEYLAYMKSLAKSYMLDWFFCGKRAIDIQDIIHKHDAQPQHCYKDIMRNIPLVINQGTNVDAFIFNFYDFILWKESGGKKEFHFTYRTSVEHFYPQHPSSSKDATMDPKYLHSFGNLCLISTSMNSKFTNKLPMSKFEEYGADEKARGLSLKLQEMFDVVESNKARGRGKEWFKDDITKAEEKALNLFKEYLENPEKL